MPERPQAARKVRFRDPDLHLPPFPLRYPATVHLPVAPVLRRGRGRGRERWRRERRRRRGRDRGRRPCGGQGRRRRAHRRSCRHRVARPRPQEQRHDVSNEGGEAPALVVVTVAEGACSQHAHGHLAAGHGREEAAVHQELEEGVQGAGQGVESELCARTAGRSVTATAATPRRMQATLPVCARTCPPALALDEEGEPCEHAGEVVPHAVVPARHPPLGADEGLVGGDEGGEEGRAARGGERAPQGGGDWPVATAA